MAGPQVCQHCNYNGVALQTGIERRDIAATSAFMGYGAVEFGAVVASQLTEIGKLFSRQTQVYAPWAAKGIYEFGRGCYNSSVVQGAGSAISSTFSYVASTTPGQFVGSGVGYVGTKLSAAGSWVAASSVGQWVSGTAYPAVAAKTVSVAGQAFASGKEFVAKTVEFGENFTALNNVSPVYGAIFTASVGLLASAVEIQLKTRCGLQNHRVLPLVLSHAIAGATVYGGALAVTAAGLSSATITAPGAAVLTGTALISTVAVRTMKKIIG